MECTCFVKTTLCDSNSPDSRSNASNYAWQRWIRFFGSKTPASVLQAASSKKLMAKTPAPAVAGRIAAH